MRVFLFGFCSCLLVGFVQAADSLHVRVIGHYTSFVQVVPGRGVATDKDSDYVCLVGSGAFLVVSVEDPAWPELTGFCDWDSNPAKVRAAGDLVYVADAHGRQVKVVSVADRAGPVIVGRCSVNLASDIDVSGSYAYVACDSYGLHIVSIADPTNPVEVGYCETPGLAIDVQVVGDYAYVAAASGGLRVISIRDPTHPVEVGSYVPGSTNVTTIGISGDYAYLGCFADRSFRVVSVLNPSRPVEVGQLDSLGYFVQEVGFAGSYAFAATSYFDEGSLRVFSIAEPSDPAQVGYYAPSFSALLSSDTGGGYVYVGSYDGPTADSYAGLWVLEFYLPGDLDVDNDSLDVVADTVRLRPRTRLSASSFRGSDGVAIEGISPERPLDSLPSLGATGDAQLVVGAFVLANTSASYNPDTSDGPSLSVIDSVHFTGSLSGPGGTLDSILIPNLPTFLAEGQVVDCSLAVFTPPGLRDGDYTGTFVISGKDTAGFVIADTFYARLSKLGDLDVDGDSLDVVADTMRLRPLEPYPLGTRSGSSDDSVMSRAVIGEFVLANTSPSYNPDTAGGPSRSPLGSVSFAGSLTGSGGTLDSILIPNLPATLAAGQVVVCSLVLYVPVEASGGEYSGVITISGRDTSGFTVEDSFYVRLTKQPGDLDIDGDTLDVAYDTMNLHTQPAGPVYHPYAKARFMLVNTSAACNPDTSDGPSQSVLTEVKAEVKVDGENGSLDSVYVLNLPVSLAAGQAVECTLAVVLPGGAAAGDYEGWVAVSATDTVGYEVRDSFFLVVRGPEPRTNLDSFVVAPIPFKPYQNPEHDAIHFQGLSAGAKVIVYDAAGHSVWSATESGDGHLKWDAKVASGIYVYLVVAQDGASKVGKLSVVR